MLLNNLSIYQNILKNSKQDVVQREDKRYEVERLHSTSPIIFDYSETYLPEGTYILEDEGSQKTGEACDSEKVSSDGQEEAKTSVVKDSVLTFRPVPVKRKEEGELLKVSALTKLIEEFQATEEVAGDADRDGGGLPLTIYLPDCSSITVHVKETSNFKEVILQVLRTHEKQGVMPPLEYKDPGMYELRIHEGDGEPDRDFPALDPEKLLSDFNLDEYCLCVVEGRRRAATGPGAGARGTANTTADTATFTPPFGPGAVSGLSGIPSGGGLSHAGSTPQLSWGAGSSALAGSSRDALDPNSVRRERDRSASKQSDDSFQNSVSTVLVVFPDGTQVVVPFKEDSKLLDLLPRINKMKRLRLYTNEYVFAVSAADQKRLKLMSPQLDMQQRVATLGATTIELHNKVYADVGKIEKATSNAKKKKSTKKSNKSNFTEAMANAYQEWNVVKKNKFGRKQERVFGVDGKKIYNSKRGQLRGGNQTGVQRAERNISTIVKLDILPTDPKTFRITWMDDRDVYNIEYTCETERECSEIVAKINYTREKYK